MACEHVNEVTLTSTSSDDTVAVLEDHTLVAKSVGVATIELSAKLPDGFGADITITVIVHSAKKAVLPDDLTAIGEEAFLNVAAVEYVIPAGCTTIGPRAFAGSGVQLITIPSSVTAIDAHAFDGCEPIIITSSGSAAEAFANANGLTVVIR